MWLGVKEVESKEFMQYKKIVETEVRTTYSSWDISSDFQGWTFWLESLNMKLRTYLTRKIECGFKDLKFYGLLMVTRILSTFIVVLLKDIRRIYHQASKFWWRLVFKFRGDRKFFNCLLLSLFLSIYMVKSNLSIVSIHRIISDDMNS